MNNNKFRFIVILSLFVLKNILNAETFNLSVIHNFDYGYSGNKIIEVNNSIFFISTKKGSKKDKLFKIDKSNSISIVKEFNDMLKVVSEYNGKVILDIEDRKEIVDKAFLYDDIKGELLKSDLYKWVKSYPFKIHFEDIIRVLYYQNDIFFIQTLYKIIYQRKPYNSRIMIYDYSKKIVEDFPLQAILFDISPDKMHLLLYEDFKDTMTLYNIQTGESKEGYGYANFNRNKASVECFLTNSLILSRIQYADIKVDRYDKCLVVPIDKPENSLNVDFNVLNNRVEKIFFSHDLTRAVVDYRSYGTDYCGLADTTPFRDWLYAKGLIFQPVEGLINADYLRIRENPNLEAPILGMLMTGTKVDVLERSGVKMQIGDNEDYWYKVKTAEGLASWAFGAFVTLSEEIIPLEPPPEVDPGLYMDYNPPKPEIQ